MLKIYLDKSEDLTEGSIGKILRRFTTKIQPQIAFHQGYYDGVGQAIMKRTMADPTKPNNRIVKNYCATIVDNFQGYLTGIPITYSAVGDANIDELLAIFKDNDVVNSDNEFLSHALQTGIAYQLCYINEQNEKRFKNLDAQCVVPIYSNDLDEDLLYCIYFYKIEKWDDDLYPPTYAVNVYSKDMIFHYESDESFNNIHQVADPEPHYFGEVPFVIFNLNETNSPIFERIISLQDAYNQLLSDEVNDFESFVDAYMVMKNVKADADDLAAMKESRTILIDGEDDVSYLTKNINDTQIQNLLENINSSIHTVSNSPDFSSEEFNAGVSSGIALQYKLVGFNNLTSSIEAQMRKALQKRIHLLNRILSLVDTAEFDVQISFTHNLPVNFTDTVAMVNSLRGLVSDETLLAQLPFIQNVEDELAKLQEQNNSFAEMYSFGSSVGDEE